MLLIGSKWCQSLSSQILYAKHWFHREQIWLRIQIIFLQTMPFLMRFHNNLNWKKIHPLFEGLVSLGILGVQLSAPLKPHDTIVLWYMRNFRCPTFFPHHAERLSNDRCCIFRLHNKHVNMPNKHVKLDMLNRRNRYFLFLETQVAYAEAKNIHAVLRLYTLMTQSTYIWLIFSHMCSLRALLQLRICRPPPPPSEVAIST